MKMILLFSFLFWVGISKIDASTSSASSYILMDMDSKNIIQSKNKDTPMLIASITKIMTCILAIENGNLDDLVVVDDVIKESYGSGIYISVGEEIMLRDLLYGLMLRSGNDAALMIAKYISGSVDEFVELMNKKAKELGMNRSIFNNPSGLDNDIGNLSTVYDMAILTSYAMKNRDYQEIVKTKKYVAKTNLKTYVWHNKNKLLSYDYITGGKTGYTEKAKRTLVSTGSKDGMNFVVVTIKDSDDWNTHTSLYEYAFNNYKSIKILDKKKFKVIGDDYYDELYIKEDKYITVRKEEERELINHIKLEKKDVYLSGMKVGVSNIYLGDELIAQTDIYVKKMSENETIFDKIRKWFTK